MNELKCLYIVGSGQNPLKHITLEGLSVLKNAHKLLIINGYANSVIEAIGGHANYEDIIGLYHDGGLDEDNYHRIINKIISETHLHQSTAVVVAGHPLVGVSWWNRLQATPNFTIDIKFIEGITSWTGMLTKLNRDPLEHGSVVLDVNRCLLFDYEFNPFLDVYLFNICSIGTRFTHFSNPAKDNGILMLKNHLLKFFPSSHLISLVHADVTHSEAETLKVPLCDLEKLLPHFHFGASIFIPGMDPDTYNKSFAFRLFCNSDQ